MEQIIENRIMTLIFLFYTTTLCLSLPTSHYAMDNSTFNINIKQRLCLPVYKRPTKCPCCKNGNLDILGTHAMACAGAPYQHTHRHDSLVKVTKDFITPAGVDVDISNQNGFFIDHPGLKPADMKQLRT